jgi:hypothetical protein
VHEKKKELFLLLSFFLYIKNTEIILGLRNSVDFWPCRIKKKNVVVK